MRVREQYKYPQKYRISEWADCQVWKFLHPQGWKTPLKLAQGQKFLPPKGRRPAGGKYFFPRANLGGFFNPRDEEIFIPDNHGPFGNCIPVRVNQAIFLFHLLWFDEFFEFFLQNVIKKPRSHLKNWKKLVKSQKNVNDFFIGHAEILISEFLVISAKLLFLISRRYKNSSMMTVAYINSYRNKGFPNGPGFRYGNFFIPRVEKTSKN